MNRYIKALIRSKIFQFNAVWYGNELSYPYDEMAIRLFSCWVILWQFCDPNQIFYWFDVFLMNEIANFPEEKTSILDDFPEIDPVFYVDHENRVLSNLIVTK